MRLTSGIWVSAYLRRCQVEGAFSAIVQRGAEEAGAIFIKIAHLDGRADLYGPAPQSLIEGEFSADRAFTPVAVGVPESDIETRLARERRFDPDIWIVEVEDRAGRPFLDFIVQ
jgi:hypothetical protein